MSAPPLALLPTPVPTVPVTQVGQTLVALLWVAGLPGGHEVIEVTQLEGAEPTWTRVSRPANATERNAVLLERFERLHADAQSAGLRMDLWLGCRPVREEMLRYAASFPSVTMRPSATDAHRALRRFVEDLLVDRRPAPDPAGHPRHCTGPRLFVATDASSALHGAGIGIACVSRTGDWAQEYVHTGVDSTLGELLAIDLALRTFPTQDLHVLTDSQAALHALSTDAINCPRLPRDVRGRLASAATSKRLQVQWVRGHNGHPLNETADRLAMAARRGAQLHQPEDSRRAVAHHIVSDLLVPAAA